MPGKEETNMFGTIKRLLTLKNLVIAAAAGAVGWYAAKKDG